MRPILISTTLCLLLASPAWAQIYQCKDASGKTVFSQTACATSDGITEKQLVAPPLPPASAASAAIAARPKATASAPARDWAAENAAANARATGSGEGAVRAPKPAP